MSLLQPALLLNATYEPLAVISWKRAFTLAFMGKAEIIETQEAKVRSSSATHLLPSVLRLLLRVKVPRFAITFNRTNVFLRDDFCCQYCLNALPPSRLTFDHVVPRSRGGKTDWTNIVTSCAPCNRRKGDHTPREARMFLSKTPKKPGWLASVTRTERWERPAVWSDYLW
jgi:5-methylcytosine-specific restriction endonuclease McrA